MIVPDSSVLIAALASYHDAHERTVNVLDDASRLIVHVAFETSSVLSRMPEGRGWKRQSSSMRLNVNSPEPWLALDHDEQRACLRRAVDAACHTTR